MLTTKGRQVLTIKQCFAHYLAHFVFKVFDTDVRFMETADKNYLFSLGTPEHYVEYCLMLDLADHHRELALQHFSWRILKKSS